MEKKIRTLFAGLIIAVLLAACQTANAASLNSSTSSSSNNSSSNSQSLSTSVMQTGVAPVGGQTTGQTSGTAQATATSQPQVTATVVPTTTSDAEIAGAIQSAKDYFLNLENQDFSSASKEVSAQSLRISGITAGDVLDALLQQSKNGATWSDLTVSGGEVFDDNTILVKVTYQLGSTDATIQKTVQTQVSETWAMRSEGGKWLFNWNNIIDVKSLDVEAQTISGLTITPLKMVRYTDKITLHMMARNVTGKDVYMGYSTQTLATFYFGSESVDAVNTLTVLSNDQTYTDYTINVAGLFTSYPDKVELIKYKTSPSTAPWFTFTLSD